MRWSTAVTLHLFGTHVGCDRHAAARRLGGQVSHCPHCRARTLGSSRPASAAQDRRVTETFPWAAVQASKQSGLHAPFRRTDTTPPCSVATGCPAESGESPSSFQPPRGPQCVSRGPPWTAGAGGRYSLLYPALEAPRLVEKEVSCRLPLLWSGTGSGVAPPTSSGSGSGSGDARLLHRSPLCVHSASQLTTEPSLPVAQTCTETPGCDLSQGRLRREGCRGEVGRGWAPGGGRGCSGPRDTEPAARSGASGNGPSLSSRLSRLETQLSCTQGQGEGPPPRPSLEALPTEPSPESWLVWAASERRWGGGGATLSSVRCFILTQSDSGSKLPSSGKLTPGLSL